METGRLAAGSSRAGTSHRVIAPGSPEESHRKSAMGPWPRLDPFSLPVRFTALDEAADGRLRVVDLHRERVVVRRSVRGMRMALNMPIAAFRGVAIRVCLGEAVSGTDASGGIAVVLEHSDPALSLPLFATNDSDEIIAEWQSWGRVLGLPLLVAETDGSLRDPFSRIGALRIETPAPRRRRRNAIFRRRPTRLLRRSPGTLAETPLVHRGEREIIARH